MMKQFFILLMLIFPIRLFAQQEVINPAEVIVLHGKDTLRLRPEVLKAIEERTLINTERQSLMHSASELPILKDFSEYLKTDATGKSLDIDSIPPGVFFLYPVDTTGYPIHEAAYKPMKSLVVKDKVYLWKKSLYMKAGTGNLFLDEVRDGQRRGTINASIGLTFSLEDALRHVFWKSERNKKRNRKRDATWKQYNLCP